MALTSATTPIEAVRACGLKDNAVVNVRKRVLLRRKRDAESARIESEAIALRLAKRSRTTPAQATGAHNRLHKIRKTTHQVDVINNDIHGWKNATKEAYKKTSAEYQQLRASGKLDRGNGGAQAIAEKYNKELPDGAKRLKSHTINKHVVNGGAGRPPTWRRFARRRSI